MMRKFIYILFFLTSSIYLNAQRIFQNIALTKPVSLSNQNFSYTGAIQIFIVPNRVTSIQISAIGAKGGTGARGQVGGSGANITTTLNVTPGQILYIVVGGFPGQSATAKYGFGGSGGSGTNYGGAGGGLSGVFTNASPAISNALIIAGGGGGGAGISTGSDYTGGNAGNTSTGTSSDGNQPINTEYLKNGRYQKGYAASTSAPGLAGEPYDSGTGGGNGSDINGGNGGSDAGVSVWNGGGGGGAGFYGGGAGAGGGAATGGGAGGASKSTGLVTTYGTANAVGDGSVSITCVYNSGLAFQLDASNSASYLNTASSVWKDLIRTNDATLYNTPTLSSSIGLTFNGTTQYGSIPSVSGVTDFTNSQKYSVEIWFKPSNGQTNSGEAELLEKWNRNNESRYPFTIRYNEGASSMFVACYDGSNFPNIGISGFPVNTWKQIVAVFDFEGKTLKVYRDGGNVVSTSLSGIGQVSNTSPIAIATRLNSTGGAQSSIMFKGTIGIIRTYNIALSLDQVLQNFNANKSRFGL
jgi:hypothetical protein